MSKMHHQSLLLGLGILGTGLASVIVIKAIKKGRSRKASRFLAELERVLIPAKALNSTPALNIRHWKSASGERLSAKAAQEHAKTIQSAWGTWYWPNDDEDKVYGVFRAIQNQAQVSQVADAYYQLSKVNLMDELRSRLDSDELKRVLSIINTLPTS